MKALDDAELSLIMCPGWVKGLFRKGKALAGLKVTLSSFVANQYDATGLCVVLDEDSFPSFLPSEVRRGRASLQAGSPGGRFPCRRSPGADARPDGTSHGVCSNWFL